MSLAPRIIVEGGVVATGDGRVLTGATIVLDGDRIAEVRADGSRPEPSPADWRIDADGRLVTPGLVNAWLRLPEAGPMASAELLSSLQCGVTGVVGHAGAEDTDGVNAFALRLGLRGLLAVTVSEDRPAPALDAAARLAARGGLRPALALGAAALWADEPLRAVLRRAEAEGWPVVLEAAAGDAELQRVWERHRCRPVERLRRMNALGERTLVGHGTLVDAGEIDTLARTGAPVALCPRTVGRLGWIAPVARLRERGALVCLGTGEAGPDLLSEVDALCYRWLTQTRGTRRLAAEVAEGGARWLGRILGIPLGAIAPGAAADLVIHRHRPVAVPAEADWIEVAGRVRGADWVIAAGRVVLREGRPLGVDPAAITRAEIGDAPDLRGAIG